MQAGSATRKSRNESPAPKPSAKAGAKSPEELKKAAAASSAAPKVEAKPEEKNILGFHPEAFQVLILGPLAVAAVVISTVFFDVGKMAIDFVTKNWKTVSAPIGKFLAKNSDMIVVLAAAAAFAPLAVVGAVTLFRATMDLHMFPWWQQAALGVLVTVACGTAWSVEGTYWTFAAIRSQWNKISDPIEHLLATKTDSIIAGAALLCLLPVVAALVTYAVRAVWGCRMKIVVEPTEEKKD